MSLRSRIIHNGISLYGTFSSMKDLIIYKYYLLIGISKCTRVFRSFKNLDITHFNYFTQSLFNSDIKCSREFIVKTWQILYH